MRLSLILLYCLAGTLISCGGVEEDEGPTPVRQIDFRIEHHILQRDRTLPNGPLPDSVVVEFLPIPGDFFGRAEGESLSVQVSTRKPLHWKEEFFGAPFRKAAKPWTRDRHSLIDSVFPADARICRVGTFLSGKDEEMLFPDSAWESYGWATSTRRDLALVYVDRACSIRGAETHCSGLTATMNLDFPGAGFYFIANGSTRNAKQEDTVRFRIEPAPAGLALAVFTPDSQTAQILDSLEAASPNCEEAQAKMAGKAASRSAPRSELFLNAFGFGKRDSKKP